MLLFLIVLLVLVALLLVGAYLSFLFFSARNGGPLFRVMAKHMAAAGGETGDYLQGPEDWIRAQPFEDVWLRSFDGLRLHGFFLPQPGAQKAVLLVHGYRGGAFQDYHDIGRRYIEAGYSVLLLEQRAHGRSEGKYITFGVRERQDVADWAAELARRTADIPLFIEGDSMGASAVLMAAGLALPERVRGLIADCGFTTPYAIFTQVVQTSFHLPLFPLRLLVDACCRLFGRFSLKGASTVTALSQNTRPVLFLHGTDDLFVPCQMTRENYAACTAPKDLLLVEGAGHFMSYATDPEAYWGKITAFLSQAQPVSQRPSRSVPERPAEPAGTKTGWNSSPSPPR